jgi:hypothetical protein
MTDTAKAFSEIIERSVSDPAFRRKLQTDAAGTLMEAGLTVPNGVTVKVVEDTESIVHIVLPPPVPIGALSDRELDSIAGGLGVAAACHNTVRRGLF